MTDLIPTESNNNLSQNLATPGGFSASTIRKAIAAKNPHFSKKELREAVNLQLDSEQRIASAISNEATRLGYRIVKQVVSATGRITEVKVPLKPARKALNLSTMSTQAIEAELLRRRALREQTVSA